MADSATEHQEPWYLRYSFPIHFPSQEGFNLSMPQSEFDALIKDIVTNSKKLVKDDDDDATATAAGAATSEGSTTEYTDVASIVSTSHDIRDTLAHLDFESTEDSQPDTQAENSDKGSSASGQHPFVQGLSSFDGSETETLNAENKMLTENGDIALRSTQSALVDLFFELEKVASGPRVLELLNAAWQEDPLAALKIIYNSRSIHLGKGDRNTFYRCAGWLKQYHPLTFITNLRWLSRPIIPKKVGKKEEDAKKEDGDDDAIIVDMPHDEKNNADEDDVSRFDVRNGVSHGFWKDLTNILALCADGNLEVLADPTATLNIDTRPGRTIGNRYCRPAKKVKLNQEEAKATRHELRDERHDRVVKSFSNDPIYRALHLTVARLFAQQLKSDLALLHDDAKVKKAISLCGKWAPSHSAFADKHACIVSSIAEMLYPMTDITGGSEDMDRELYLRHARERYRKDVSALRAHLDIVERSLTAKTYDQIKYDRLPSIAMKNYAKTFAERDTERFEQYIEKVAAGKMRISGATLFPSELIAKVRNPQYVHVNLKDTKQAIEAKIHQLEAKVLDGQWKTLVQRIKDSGTLESSIAVCDVSGSMCSPRFSDGTSPIDSSIGLSLLLAEVTKPPFGGHFITFSSIPTVETIDLSASLHDKYWRLQQSLWEMTTDFVAVFEKLILPMAKKNKLSQEDMVKRIFVFSDMQFNQASHGGHFSSSLERIKKQYAEAGYEMPELVFWNLAGGRAGYNQYGYLYGDPTAPKPAAADEEGISLVSGYSQAMLKVFLDNGTFGEDEEDKDEEAAEVKVTEDGEVVVVEDTAVKKAKNALAVCLGHHLSWMRFHLWMSGEA
ncbi:hypothetical protein F5Y16DRAFT_358974 [Xylariaceae sp. FL0255]|nr:hypothetical protein F5Y16DRAFT_358974 [Xylariaceae sp. FL0255]